VCLFLGVVEVDVSAEGASKSATTLSLDATSRRVLLLLTILASLLLSVTVLLSVALLLAIALLLLATAVALLLSVTLLRL
jgi:hypothetical protein